MIIGVLVAEKGMLTSEEVMTEFGSLRLMSAMK
jgi:hypothetical protein